MIRIFFLVVTSFAGSMLAGSALAVTITFDPFEVSGSGFVVHGGTLDIGDYRFTSLPPAPASPVLVIWQQESDFYNGSAALSSGNDSDIVLTRIDGGSFDVLSVDLESAFGPNTIELNGNLSGGGTVQQLFSTDLLLGAETVALTGFSNLESLRFDVSGASAFANVFGQIDNLVFVPEPSTALLVGLGLAGLAGVRKRAAT